MRLFLVFLLSFSQLFSQTIHKSESTLNKIREVISKKQKGAYLRFGDGDIALAHGFDDSNQVRLPELAQEMRAALSLNGPTVLKCLPLTCKEMAYEEGMFPGNHELAYGECINTLNQAFPFWGARFGDVYSMTALAYAATNNTPLCLSFLKFLKASNCTILVGNENIPRHVIDVLFGPDCRFVPTPSRNSFFDIDRIEEGCLELAQQSSDYQVIITSMGCSGRPFQYRLWRQLDNVFLFDFGSLMDAICGWDTRDWIYLNRDHFANRRFLQLLEEELQ